MSVNFESAKPVLGSRAPNSKLPQELLLIDGLCERWAKWVARDRVGTEWPRMSLLGKAMEKGVSHERLYPGAGRDKPPTGVMLIDVAISRLPEALQRCVQAEYCIYGPAEVKCRAARLSRTMYYIQLRNAQWLLYGRLAQQFEDA